jgi:putative heme-binding domain-containing protein
MRLKFAALLLLLLPSLSARGADFELKRGDHICLIGNTLAERMQHDGWLDTLLNERFPQHQLVIRNLGFSGDELNLRLRSAGFGSPDEHLTRQKADVILAFFGYNESYAGAAGLEKFRQELDAFVQHTLSQKYNGTSAPRLVLFSPIAHEDLGDRNLPDGRENNERLAMYTAAMSEVATARGVAFVDIFHASAQHYATSKDSLTFNGVHLNELGGRLIAQSIVSALFPSRSAPAADEARLARIRQAVLDKSFHWFQRYRTVDGYSTYGGRADLKFVNDQTNRVVMQRELEILDVMTANRDQVVWAAAQGRELTVDDSNTPDFIPVITNKPGNGPNGEHLYLGGLEAVSNMQVAEGTRVELFASEEMFPELANPVQMAFDTRGRLWVAVMPSYPHWKPKEKMSDKVLILEDQDHDGRADKMIVFADELHVPTGMEFYAGGVLVGQQPDLMFLKDTDGDDIADVRQRVLHGIDSADTHHALNSFTFDPGGALYFQEGTFHHTQVETPWGPPTRSANAAVFRYEPRTQKFDVYVAYGFANPHGHVFDRWGQDFVTDGTGNVNYYATAFSGHIDFPRKHPGMEPIFRQRTRPCPATEYLSSRHFPERFQGTYLVGNVIGFQGILQYRIRDDGSGFTGDEIEPLVQSSDPSFRPVDMEVGPDGALYFIDWQNPIIGHMQHNLRDPSRDTTHGRVYRLYCPDRPLLEPPTIAGAPIASLLELLKEPEDRVRYRAKIELGGRDSEQVIAAVRRWIATLNPTDPEIEHHLTEALWVHQYHNVVDQGLLQRMLRSGDFRARAAATRVLCYWRDRVDDPLALLQIQADDEHPRVRLEAVRACSFFREARAAEVALLALKHPRDYYLNYTLTETMRQLEPYWKQAVAEGRLLAVDNPAGVDYLLQSVDTAELINLPRTPLVYQALLSRHNVLPEYRQEALQALAKLNNTDVMSEMLSAVERLDASDTPHSDHVLNDLAHMLTGRPANELQSVRQRLAGLASDGRRPSTRQVAYVTLIVADKSVDATWDQASQQVASLRDLLAAVPLLPDPKLRAAAHTRLKPLLTGLPAPLASQVDNRRGSMGRFVRIELPQRGTLTLAEVQVFSDGKNIAASGQAKQSSVGHGGEPSRAIDGNTSGRYGDGGQTHTAENDASPWWELDLQNERPIEAVAIWTRSENNGQFAGRLDQFRILVLDQNRQPVFEQANNPAPAESARFELQEDPAGAIRRAAIEAIVTTGQEPEQTFTTLAGFVKEDHERATAVRALGRLPRSHWPKKQLQPLIATILEYIGGRPVSERTSISARDALQLGNDLAGLLPASDAQAARRALRELGVPVIVVRPVPHQMVYDKPQIFVEAGKPIEIIFENADIMPHNLIVARPGSLEKVGVAGEKMAADPQAFEKHFVPNLPEVLHATRLLQPREADRLNFTAPTELGDYPIVCTFPGHWRRMNGVMHVVRSLDEVPADVLLASQTPAQVGEERPFVRAWTVADLAADLEHLEHGRDLERGQQLFAAVACNQCHRINNTGAQIGPDLSALRQKLAEMKMTRQDVLREMIEPSKVIDDKFRTFVFQLSSGNVVTGIVAEEKDGVITLRGNPLDPMSQNQPQQIAVDEVEERLASQTSLMPQGMINVLSREEILDLLAFLISGNEHGH